mmetsp:Transcript_44580/g.141968  ORF Transcript_44580/g.141968 Transcript_44580/m.141968 type:complete len:212 (+) Transcript_44580:155-790(+)
MNMSVSPAPPHVVQVMDRFPAFPGTDMTSVPDSFKAFLQRCPDRYLDLPGGRRLCFFSDGDEDGATILAFHGGCEGKFKFARPAAIPGVRLVAVDRPHYGGSSSIPLDYSFEDAARDVAVLADHLGLGEFVVMGHSVGTSWALQLAASPLLSSRVKGVILFSTMVDPKHPETKGRFRENQDFVPDALDPVTGCCGCVLRRAFGGGVKDYEA